MRERLRPLALWLASIECWSVLAVVALSMISERLFPLALAVVLFFWVMRWLAYGSMMRRTPADIAIILLLLMLPVTLWVTPDPATTIPQVYRLIIGIALYYAIVNWAGSPARLHWLLIGLVLTTLGLALSAIVTVQWDAWGLARLGVFPFLPLSLYEHFPLWLPVTDTVNPNVMAGNLTLLLPFGASLLLFAWDELHWAYRLLALSSVLASLGIIILTQSRGGLMALAATLLALLILRWHWCLIPLAVPTIVSMLAIQLSWGHQVWETMGANISAFITARSELWVRGLAMIHESPLTGIGMGTFLEHANSRYPFVTEGYRTEGHHAHNLFLQIAVDLGIPGLIAWTSLLVLIIRLIWQIYWYARRMSATNSEKCWFLSLGAGLLASQVALISHGMLDAVTWGMVRPAPLIWAIWGTAVASWMLLCQNPASGMQETHETTGN